MTYHDLKALSKETSLSVFTLRKFVKMGLPHFRVGKKILVKLEDFNEWFETHHRGRCTAENPTLDTVLEKALIEAGLNSP